MKIILKLIIIILIIGVIGAVAALGYMGFVPGISKIFGSDQPKDLGVSYMPQDLESYLGKAKISIEPLDPNISPMQSLSFSGKSEINVSFTDKEITAMVNNDLWKYYPVSDAQIRINSNGMVEASGILRKDRLEGYARAQKISEGEVQAAMKFLNFVPVNPTFYASGTGSIVNNQVSVVLDKMEIGRLAVPDKIKNSTGIIANFIEDRIGFVPNFYVKNLTFSNGQMNYEGTFPAVQSSSQR